MEELLGAVAPYLEQGSFGSIRVSTRPDALDHARLKLLLRHGVRTIELGVQSMSDEVLSLSKRGHTAEDTIKSVHRLKRYGFAVGVQLMPGLPGDSIERFRDTISMVLDLRPDMARLYPVLVIEGTELAALFARGVYRPLSLEDTIEWCAEAFLRLEAAGIQVIRVGLMASPHLTKGVKILAGPWHPALGFLVRAEAYRRKTEPILNDASFGPRITVYAPRRELALLRGYRNEGFLWLRRKTGAREISLKCDETISEGRLEIRGI
jgi:histone acetyltransferase (RNA polymerase elongator complex component)